MIKPFKITTDRHGADAECLSDAFHRPSVAVQALRDGLAVRRGHRLLVAADWIRQWSWYAAGLLPPVAFRRINQRVTLLFCEQAESRRQIRALDDRVVTALEDLLAEMRAHIGIPAPRPALQVVGNDDGPAS